MEISSNETLTSKYWRIIDQNLNTVGSSSEIVTRAYDDVGRFRERRSGEEYGKLKSVEIWLKIIDSGVSRVLFQVLDVGRYIPVDFKPSLDVNEIDGGEELCVGKEVGSTTRKTKVYVEHRRGVSQSHQFESETTIWLDSSLGLSRWTIYWDPFIGVTGVKILPQLLVSLLESLNKTTNLQ